MILHRIRSAAQTSTPGKLSTSALTTMFFLAVLTGTSHGDELEALEEAWEQREGYVSYSFKVVERQKRNEGPDELLGNSRAAIGKDLCKDCRFSASNEFYSFVSTYDVVEPITDKIIKTRLVRRYDHETSMERESVHTFFSQKALDELDEPYVPTVTEEHSKDVPKHFFVLTTLLPIQLFHDPNKVLAHLLWELEDEPVADEGRAAAGQRLLKFKLTRKNKRWSSTIHVDPELKYAPVKWTLFLDGDNVQEISIKYKTHVVPNGPKQIAVQSYRIVSPEREINAIVTDFAPYGVHGLPLE